MRDMPGHFRFKLTCTDCGASLAADGHNSMSCLDAYLSEHIAAFGHKEYDLVIRLDRIKETLPERSVKERCNMDYELQCWGEQNLKEYREEDPKYGVCEIVLPWVVISKHQGGEIVEFSSDKRSEAMEYMMDQLIRSSYDDWEDDIIETFGLSTEVIHQIILGYILTPKEKDLLKL